MVSGDVLECLIQEDDREGDLDDDDPLGVAERSDLKYQLSDRRRRRRRTEGEKTLTGRQNKLEQDQQSVVVLPQSTPH